jgi:hypothetical protein
MFRRGICKALISKKSGKNRTKENKVREVKKNGSKNPSLQAV